MSVSVATYKRVALEDEDETWELICGTLRRKPGMTHAHNSASRWWGFRLQEQLDFGLLEVSHNSARLLTGGGSYYVPDVTIIPHAWVAERLEDRELEAYEEPVSLVVEVWSKSTGDYDVEEKLVEYQRRGDLEIWRIHPYEKTLTSWVRQEDGSYSERTLTSGVITCAALPGVTIDLDQLFALI